MAPLSLFLVSFSLDGGAGKRSLSLVKKGKWGNNTIINNNNEKRKSHLRHRIDLKVTPDRRRCITKKKKKSSLLFVLATSLPLRCKTERESRAEGGDGSNVMKRHEGLCQSSVVNPSLSLSDRLMWPHVHICGACEAHTFRS